MEKPPCGNPWKPGFPLRLEIPQQTRDFHFSHSFNNNKLDDPDHFLENATASVASLRGLITSTRNADHDQFGIPITFIGIRNFLQKL